MKKITLFLLSLFMMLSIVSCQKNDTDTKPNNTEPNRTVTTSPTEIEQKIASAIGTDHYLCTVDIEESWLKNYFGLDMDKIEAYVAKQNPIAAVNPDTVIILKTHDGYAKEAADKLNTAYAQQVSYIRLYPFGVQKVLGARIFCDGNYVMYILAGESYEGENSEEEAKLATSEYAKIDSTIKEIFQKALVNIATVPEDAEKGGGLIQPENTDEREIVLGE